MHKSFKIDLAATLALFILLNTSQLWEGKLGGWAMLSTLGLFLAFLALFIRFSYHLYKLAREKGKNRYRLIIVSIMGLVLILAAYEPRGLVNYNLLYGERVFYAYYKGVAGCSSNLYLHDNGKFHYQTVCFGMKSTTGRYRVSNDSIFFESTVDNFFSYGVYDPEPCRFNISDSENGSIKLYKNEIDTIYKADLCILENEIIGK